MLAPQQPGPAGLHCWEARPCTSNGCTPTVSHCVGDSNGGSCNGILHWLAVESLHSTGKATQQPAMRTYPGGPRLCRCRQMHAASGQAEAEQPRWQPRQVSVCDGQPSGQSRWQNLQQSAPPGRLVGLHPPPLTATMDTAACLGSHGLVEFLVSPAHRLLSSLTDVTPAL